MIHVGVNPPKTPVTEGSLDMAPATLPNICKMPGPPAPFVPTPFPNLGRSADRLKKATSTVKIKGKKIAIKGSYYMSQPSPDVASKGTGGGIISASTQGTTKFVGLGSMNVKAEGKNIQLLGDAMTNNGSNPDNSADIPGNQQGPATPEPKEKLVCGEVGEYSKLCEKDAKGAGMERDHIPAKATLRERAFKKAGGEDSLSTARATCIKNGVEARGIAIAIPKESHAAASKTYKNLNKGLMHDDAETAETLNAARERDLQSMEEHFKGKPCEGPYAEAAKKVRAHDNEKMIDDVIAKCKKANPIT